VDLAELSGPLFATVPQRNPMSLVRAPLTSGKIVSILRTLADQAGIVSSQSISADTATELRHQYLNHEHVSTYASWQTYSAV
jgi:hypothetical protein